MIVQKQQDILATPKSAYITKIEILDRLSATDSIQSIYRNGIELVNFGNYNIDRLYIDTTCEPATEYTYSLYINGSEVCSTTVTTPDAAQKYANQVRLGNKTLMDITDSTVTPETLLEGETAYNAAGEFITGTGSLGAVRYDATQELTNEQKAQARTNIGAETSGTAASLINRTNAVNVADTNYGAVMARGIYAGTTDLTDGVTDLTSGVIYLVYEE